MKVWLVAFVRVCEEGELGDAEQVPVYVLHALLPHGSGRGIVEYAYLETAAVAWVRIVRRVLEDVVHLVRQDFNVCYGIIYAVDACQRAKAWKAWGADLSLSPPRPLSPWRSRKQLPRPLCVGYLLMIVYGDTRLAAPVTEADATRCRTARMINNRVKGCGGSRNAVISDQCLFRGEGVQKESERRCRCGW